MRLNVFSPITAGRLIFEKHIIALDHLLCGAVWCELWQNFFCRNVVQRGISNIQYMRAADTKSCVRDITNL